MSNSGNYIIYLRKSRADMEAEARGEGETLSRHQQALLDLAQKMGIYIPPDNIYREIVSGETISARPVMQRLLSEVEQEEWDGVFVMEVERLARGDTIDQGIVARAFQISGTKIITPTKIYDPNNEFDEEYFEFGLFMSRREYKTIKRRMQSGRIASIKEGKYVGNKPPYGYVRQKLHREKGFKLVPHPDEAPVVAQIFAWYAYGKPTSDGGTESMGTTKICRELMALKIPSPSGGKRWSAESVRSILKNPTYTGKLRWGWRAGHKSIKDGKIITRRPRAPEDQWLLSQGLHEAIVSDEVYQAVQARMALNPTRPAPGQTPLKNPLANIIICGFCGHRMQRRPYESGYKDTLLCSTLGCRCVSASLEAVEQKLLQGLKDWLDGYLLKINDDKKESMVIDKEILETSISKAEKEVDALQLQRERVYTLYEQGDYSRDTFTERRAAVESKLQAHKDNIINLREQLLKTENETRARAELVPRVEKVLNVYNSLTSAQDKNDLLREIIDYVEYRKTERSGPHSKVDPNNFELIIHPRLPKG